MKFFCIYLKSKLRPLIVLSVCIAVFICSFALYHLPIKAVCYPCALCILVLLIFAVYDYLKTYKVHRVLEKLNSNNDTVIENLPNASNIVENDYQKIITDIHSEQKTHIANADKKYSERIGYFTLWAHQIKTPIASAKLNLQNSDTKLSRTVSSDLFRIEQYVDMALTFLRLDSDSTDYSFSECDLNLVIKAVIRKFSSEFILRKISLDYSQVNASIVTDEKWLSFVIEQVISNSLKYTHTGGKISIYYRENKFLTIEDSGIGISASDLPRIFENGFTGYNGRSSKNSSGIGLYLCKRVCDNLGYDIFAESEVGKGTKITIDLSKKHEIYE